MPTATFSAAETEAAASDSTTTSTSSFTETPATRRERRRERRMERRRAAAAQRRELEGEAATTEADAGIVAGLVETDVVDGGEGAPLSLNAAAAVEEGTDVMAKAEEAAAAAEEGAVAELLEGNTTILAAAAETAEEDGTKPPLEQSVLVQHNRTTATVAVDEEEEAAVDGAAAAAAQWDITAFVGEEAEAAAAEAPALDIATLRSASNDTAASGEGEFTTMALGVSGDKPASTVVVAVDRHGVNPPAAIAAVTRGLTAPLPAMVDYSTGDNPYGVQAVWDVRVRCVVH